MMSMNGFLWPALGLAFLLGLLLSRWVYGRIESRKTQVVNKEYFKGLNFLLDEETDKAIEVFINALEVDSDTVELHLALGGLFRRKGQVDRATRIHQNLIARPSLTDDQRMQAIHELACDYHRAGWLDRAENLFLELKESEVYQPLAIVGLCRIYEQEKEWQKAIDILHLHKRHQRVKVCKQVAHYYCELAEISIENNDFQAAKKYLKLSRIDGVDIGRSLLLVGELEFAGRQYAQARNTWRKLSISHPKLAELVVEKTILSYVNGDSESGLRDYLLGIAVVPRDKASFVLWQESLVSVFGSQQAAEIIFEKSLKDSLSAPLAEYLYVSVGLGFFNESQRHALLKKMLCREKESKIEYSCVGCGFDTKSMYWFCPNCGQWESFE